MKFLSKPFLAVAMTAILTVIVSTASAIDLSKPSAVISFGGYNKTVADLNALGEATGQPGMGSTMDMMLKMMVLQGKNADVINQDQPWGVAIYSSEEVVPGTPPNFFIFLPVSDITKFAAMLEGFKFKSEKIGEGHYKFQPPKSGKNAKEDPMLVKQQGSWIFLAAKEEMLENLPTDPVSLLDGLDKKYLFAIQVNGQNDGMKFIKEVVAGSMQEAAAGRQAAALVMSGKSPEEVNEIMKNSPPPTLSLAELGPPGMLLQQMGDQIDTLTLGLTFDKEGSRMKDLQLDLQIKAMPGTELDKKIGRDTELTSEFSGFFDPAAAIALNTSSQANADTIKQMQQKVAMFQMIATRDLAQRDLNEDELAMAKKWITRLSKTIEATVTQGRLDMGFQLQYAPGTSTALFGIKVVNGQECDEIIRQLSKLLAKETGAPASVTLDVDSVGDVKLHKLQPVPPSPVFGPSPDMILGVSDTAVYISIGKDAIASLKSAIQQSKSMTTEKRPTVRLSLDVPQVLKMVNDAAPERQKPIPEQVLMQVLMMFGSDKGNNVTMTTLPIEGGMIQRLELSPSIIGTLIKAAQGMMMPGGGMPGGGGGGGGGGGMLMMPPGAGTPMPRQ